MFAFFQYKMTSMKILFAVISFLSLFSTAKLTTVVVDLDSRVKYQEGQWIANVACTFYNQSNCLLSMHVEGRRIDVQSSKSNEDVYASCFSTNTSIALSISNYTYEDIQDYTCLQDTTQQHNHTWLTANPYIEVEANQSAVNLTCNSVPGAPLYWVLPGDQQDNKNVQIVNTSNEVNSSITAIVLLDDIQYTSQYNCCSLSKDGQFPNTCSSYKFNSQDPTVYLASTSADFMNSNSMSMTCVLRREFYAPDTHLIGWQQCKSSTCSTVSSSYYTSKADNATSTLTTTLKLTYSSSYNYYRCLYDGQPFNSFDVLLGSKSPFVHQNSKEVFYSTDTYAVKLTCLVSSNPQPSVTWTQNKFLSFSNGTEIITSGGNYHIDMFQISTAEWQTTLIIDPYDVTIHNNIYTCIVNNSLGQHSAQLNTNKGPAEMDVILLYNLKWTDTTNAIRAICTFKTFPFLPNYHINVVTAESIHFNTTATYDDQQETVMVTVNFEANVKQFPATVECTTFNPFDSKSQMNDKIYIDSNTPIS